MRTGIAVIPLRSSNFKHSNDIHFDRLRFLCGRNKECLMKTRRDEGAQFTEGNGVDCGKDSIAFQLVNRRNGQCTIDFDPVTRRNGQCTIDFDPVTRRNGQCTTAFDPVNRRNSKYTIAFDSLSIS